MTQILADSKQLFFIGYFHHKSQILADFKQLFIIGYFHLKSQILADSKQLFIIGNFPFHSNSLNMKTFLSACFRFRFNYYKNAYSSFAL